MSNESFSKKFAATIMEWIDAAVFSIVFVVVLFTFFINIVGVFGISMENTLQDGNKLFIEHFLYEPNQGDIVVISRNYTNDETTLKDLVEKPLIKRVIAVEGQTVNIKDGKVYIDDVLQNEPYARTQTTLEFTQQPMTFPVTVEKGKVFVLGDNRDHSHDSRSSEIGQVDKRFILGKAFIRIFPTSEFGLLE